MYTKNYLVKTYSIYLTEDFKRKKKQTSFSKPYCRVKIFDQTIFEFPCFESFGACESLFSTLNT